MKHLRETFTDQEWESFKAIKEQSGMNWHDFLLINSSCYVKLMGWIDKYKDFQSHTHELYKKYSK